MKRKRIGKETSLEKKEEEEGGKGTRRGGRASRRLNRKNLAAWSAA